MKIVLNPMFKEVSGQLDDIVFRRVRGKVVAGSKAIVTAEPSEDQAAQRQRFKQAVAYGKSVMADSSLRALYEEAAKSKDMPLFALTIADYFNEPEISNIDLSAYMGQLGNQIKVNATDDFGVASVQVFITREDNSAIESGNAVETAPGSGVWLYTITNSIGAGTVVNVRAVATDRPGGTADLTATKTL